MYVLTAENMKKTEEKAVSRGHTFYAMMDMAGTKCAGVIAGENENLRECRVVILCGKGKNGGDGLVIAFRLFELGFKTISVVLSGGKPQDELCLKMFERMKKAPVNIIDYTKNPGSALYAVSNSQMIIDCLFGIGFKGQLRGAAADLVETANLNKKAVKYAVDIPSGLSADGSFSEGQLYFKTRKTLSMIAFKPVHVLKPAASFCGKTYVIDIGVSEEDIREHSEKYTAYTDREAFLDIKERAFDCNKGDFGRVLIIAGSRNMSGCVYLCAQGAVEAGAGLVTAAFPDCIYNSAAPKLNEPLMLPLTSNAQGGISSSCTEILKEKISSASVIALGCGMGTWEDSAYITEFVLKNADCPVIIASDLRNGVTATAHCSAEMIDKYLPKMIVEELQSKYNSKLEEIYVYVGAHAGNSWTYDTWPKWAKENFWEKTGAITEKDGIYRINLRVAMLSQLNPEVFDTFIINNDDTITNPNYYSNSAARTDKSKDGRHFEGAYYQKNKRL